MTDRPRSIGLVGGGLAAAKAAETLRAGGYDGGLWLLGEEVHHPYDRPPLSKQLLTGSADPSTVELQQATFYTDHDIELITDDAAVALDRQTSTVTTRTGRQLGFDRLLLATGATPRQLPVTDQDLEGIVTLRTLDDALSLRRRLENAGHVAVVGAGWIGCEVAAAARQHDAAVTLIDPLATPLQRVVGAEVGQVFAELHREHGVELRLGVSVSDVGGTDRVEQLRLSDETALDVDLVVVGIGVSPRTELAESAGLVVDDGIVADQWLACDDPRVFVAGDVANAWHPHYGHHVRVEHWANALHQGETAALNMVGGRVPYARLPYFFSDQYELGLEYVGMAAATDEVVFRGDPSTREFIAFWLRAGRVTAAMNVNVWDVVDELTAIVAGPPVDLGQLTDPDVGLSDLAARAA